MTANQKFVFFRYPDEEACMIVEDHNASDQFVFVDFLQNNPLTIQGTKSSYSENYRYNVIRNNPVPYLSTKEEYLAQFDHYKQAFAQRKIKKAILSRVEEVELDIDDLHVIFQELCKAYPKAMVYMASLAEYGVWGGATPEKLLEYKDAVAKTVALAGTQKTDDPSAWGKKEKEEHREVEKYIEEISLDDRFELLEKSPVYLKKAGKVFHQKSDFTIAVDEKNVGSFLELLHPTPAVCGTPLESSLALILETEKHDRSFYTGYLGLTQKNKNQETQLQYYVNLRCMQIIGSKAYLYLGGGITNASDGLSEWQETIDKSKTLLSILKRK